MSALLDDFIRHELSDHLVGLIKATVAEAQINPEIALREFNGNVFDLAFNFKRSEVIITNILETDSEGVESLSVDQFLTAIGAKV
ncbi:hypothetical protein KUV22_09380 [Microbulbifer agarilyticus]|uniref:hypothetical protein n=1 Tax=Microbulbifer agarilyticus TaxID=260552 RepID=UPI001C96B29D|nr:hypothetical protein [Microbulbifer agarilyticus]MBY6190624.1 hypothetical protein [Microbulbifer agarilyticus]